GILLRGIDDLQDIAAAGTRSLERLLRPELQARVRQVARCPGPGPVQLLQVEVTATAGAPALARPAVRPVALLAVELEVRHLNGEGLVLSEVDPIVVARALADGGRRRGPGCFAQRDHSQAKPVPLPRRAVMELEVDVLAALCRDRERHPAPTNAA